MLDTKWSLMYKYTDKFIQDQYTLKNIIDNIKGVDTNINVEDDPKNQMIARIKNIRKLTEQIENETDTDKLSKLKDQKKKIKCLLPAIAPSAIFEDLGAGRVMNNVKSHNGIICIDIDNISKVEVDKLLKEQIEKNKFLLMAFKSPSYGLKLFYKIKIYEDKDDIAQHLIYFKYYSGYFNKRNIIIDEACKDIVRLCYLSHDPDVYINEKCGELDKGPTIDRIKTDKHSIEKNNYLSMTNDAPIVVGMELYYKYIVNFDIKGFCSFIDKYENWIAFGYGLIKYFEKDQATSLFYFDKFSMLGSTYNKSKAEAQFKTLYNGFEKNKCKYNLRLTISKLVGNGTIDPVSNKELCKFFKYDEKTLYNILENMDLDIKWNDLTEELEIKWEGKKQIVDEKIQSEICMAINFEYPTLLFNATKLDGRITGMGKNYNPILDKLKTLKCDDGEEFEKFVDHIETDLDPIDFEAIMGFWMLGVFNNVFNNDIFKFMLIFKGITNVGKTYMINHMLKPFYKLSTANFNWDIAHKDSMVNMGTKLFIIDEECSQLNRGKLDQIKNITSMAFIDQRLSYAKRNKQKKRVCSFIGSSNDDTLFYDDTKAERFIGVEVKSRNQDLFDTIDFEKVWGYIYKLYKEGKRHNDADLSELITDISEKNRVISDEEGIINEYFEYDEAGEMAFEEIKDFVAIRVRDYKTNNGKISKLLNNLGIKQKRKGSSRVWSCKLIPNVAPDRIMTETFFDRIGGKENVLGNKIKDKHKKMFN